MAREMTFMGVDRKPVILQGESVKRVRREPGNEGRYRHFFIYTPPGSEEEVEVEVLDDPETLVYKCSLGMPGNAAIEFFANSDVDGPIFRAISVMVARGYSVDRLKATLDLHAARGRELLNVRAMNSRMPGFTQ